jgi:O-antigen ligase
MGGGGLLLAALGVSAIVVFLNYGGQAIFALVFALLLLSVALNRPLTLVYFLLLTGSLSWGFVTGDEKVFFEGFGGLDLNGIRLVGVVLTFSFLLLHRPGGLRRFFALKPYLLFLVFAALGLVYTWNFNSGIRLFSKFLYPYLIFCVLLLEVNDAETVEKVIRVMLWGALVALVSIPVSIFFGVSTQFTETMVLVGGGATHRNPFAFYMVCITGLTAALYTFRRQGKYLLITLVGSGVVLLSITRIAIAALAVILGIIFFRRSVLRGVLVSSLALAAIVSYGPIRERMFYQGSDMSFVDLVKEPRRVFTDVNAMGRFPAWGAGIYLMFLRSPVVGMGTGSTTGIEYEAGNRLTAMHSEVVRILAEQGLVGTGLYILAYLLLLVKLNRLGAQASATTCALSLAASALIIGYAVICLTDNAFDYYTMLGQNIFAVAALALKSAELERINHHLAVSEH